MTATTDCDILAESVGAYVDGTLPAETLAIIENHLQSCQACRAGVEQVRTVKGLMEYIDCREPIAEVSAVPAPSAAGLAWHERLGAAPWWVVSCSLHILVIALASLVSMAIDLPQNDDAVIMVTELQARNVLNEQQVQKKPDAADVLNKTEVAATDLNSKEVSDIVVPPDILAKAGLSDHFETVNPELPDTHGALGNPDARMFHSVQGNTEAEGGGGTGGLGMDDVVGIGGAATRGTGGGFGGGDGSGIGVGTGAGRGSFGQRSGGGRKLLVRRNGGSAATESAVDRALEWLAYHQEADGSWSLERDQSFPALKGISRSIGDVAATGYALLAFLGAGHTDKMGKYKENVKRGLGWIIEQLKDNNRWNSGYQSNYSQGIGTMALAEACAMNPRNAELKKAAQQAANGVMEGQIKTGPSEYQGWDYAPGGTTNDTSVTGWNIMALKSAKVAGLHFDVASFEGAMNWIHAGQNIKNAPEDAEYWEGGLMSYRGTLDAPNGPGDPPTAVAAIAAVTRLFIGGEKPTSPGVAGPCNFMRKKENLPTQWPGNLYYWYYGTLANFQRGGDGWKEWNTALKATLIENQRKDGDFAGSWDEGQNGLKTQYGGRVMSTSLGCLCLEVYYRYLQLNNSNK